MFLKIGFWFESSLCKHLKQLYHKYLISYLCNKIIISNAINIVVLLVLLNLSTIASGSAKQI